jgi:hypothetical protein
MCASEVMRVIVVCRRSAQSTVLRKLHIIAKGRVEDGHGSNICPRAQYKGVCQNKGILKF